MRTFAPRSRAQHTLESNPTTIPAPPAARTQAAAIHPGEHAGFQHDFSQVRARAGAAPIQAKLLVGAAGDAHEREAERVAGEVMRDGAAGPAEGRAGAILQASRNPSTAPGARPVDEGFADRLARGGGGGSPLPGPARAFFEPRFGHDFSSVRVHADSHAAGLNQSLGARAFAHGGALYFGAGQYDPASSGGRRLIAHELTHVVQQRNGLRQIQRAPPDAAAVVVDPAIATLKSALIATYGLADVTEGDQEWTADHLRQVTDAFALLPATDTAALSGVVLHRVQSLGGRTAGRFRLEQSVDDTTVVNEATLSLADLAFAGGGHETIVHEVGHAVAALKQRTAHHTANEATAGYNEKVAVSNAASEELNEVVEARNLLVGPYNAASRAYAKARKSGNQELIDTARQDFEDLKAQVAEKDAEAAPLRAAHKAAAAETRTAKTAMDKKAGLAASTDISAAALTAVKKEAAKKKTAHTKALAAAKKRAGKLKADVAAEAEAYITAVDEAGTAIGDFAAKTASQSLSADEVESEIESVQGVLDARDTQRTELAALNAGNPALAAFAKVEAAQQAWFHAARAHSLAHQRSAMVHAFATFVIKKGIAPITDYARENWPHKPEEFFAEAYSWYWTRPADLLAASKDLHDWFAAGKYR